LSSISQLVANYTIDQMIDFYLKRNPFGYEKEELLTRVVDFSSAEDDFTPRCYRNKTWELIKLDIERIVKQ